MRRALGDQPADELVGQCCLHAGHLLVAGDRSRCRPTTSGEAVGYQLATTSRVLPCITVLRNASR
jgi:hypothetical protein